MMKRLVLLMGLLTPFLVSSQTKQKPKVIEIKKLVIDKRDSYELSSKDSSVSIFIDTLVMRPDSKIKFFNKKDVTMVVRHAIIDKGAWMGGSDGKNNGTNLKLDINFFSLKDLSINVSGQDAKSANRKFDNGNGGDVVINYLSSGVSPQIQTAKQSAYIEVNNRGGGYRTNPQYDLAVIFGQIRSGSPGRPLGQLANGRVYSGGYGSDGKTSIQAVTTLSQ